MLIDIELQQLRCDFQKHSDGADPYLWAELLIIDDDTLAPNGAVVARDGFSPSLEFAPSSQFLLQEKMKAGDTAPIPDEIAHLGTRFREGLITRDLILVAVLWDLGSSELGSEMEAGFGAFLLELRDAVADKFPDLLDARLTGKDASPIIQDIKKRVNDKVEAVISDNISLANKLAIGLGSLTLDRLIDSQFKMFEDVNVLTPPTALGETLRSREPFTLTFHNDNEDFKLDAQLVVTIDPCEDELIQVESLKENIATIQGALRQAGDAHGGEPGPQGEQKIDELVQRLRAEQAKLKRAQEALERCRHLPDARKKEVEKKSKN